jgi:hypothetical protein
MRRTLGIFSFAFLLALPVGAALPGVVAAATFSVNVTTDGGDANPKDGVCATDKGDCTLRAAIQQAIVAGGGTIFLQPLTYSLSILGPADDDTDSFHGDLDILAGSIVVRGSSGLAVIRGASGFNDRILDVHAGAQLTLDDIQVSGGHSPNGAGIRNAGSLTTIASTVSGNASTFGFGGGIYSSGTLLLENSTVSGNSAGQVGGGIYTTGANAQLNVVTVSGNSSLQGGGIYNSASGGLVLNRATVSGNTASDGAGAMNAGTLQLINVTLSGNRATGNGGAIWNSASVSANNVTVASNTADSDASGAGDGGGLFFTSGTVAVANSLIGLNTDLSTSGKYPDCFGALQSNGSNLIQNTAGCSIFGISTGNIVGRDPVLGPLQLNGGSLATQALLPSQKLFGSPSPAIDAGAPAATKAVQCETNDERNVARTDGNGDGLIRCDIGAFEYQPSVSIGTFDLSPNDARASVGQHVAYSLTWTVPTGGWRQLDTLELRFVDQTEGPVLWLRYHEVAGELGTFAVVNGRTLVSGPAFAPGSPNRLQSAYGFVFLAGCTVVGPPGPTVTLTLDLVFKPISAGQTYDVEVLATSDSGASQGFARAGSIAVAH